MRCSYCGGLNQERATFCVNCGRDLTRQSQAPYQQPAQPVATPQSQRVNASSAYRAPNQQAQPQQGHAPARSANQATQASRRHPAAPNTAQAPVVPPPSELSKPEPPGPFPPRTMDQFNALLTPGAQDYTVVESSLSDGKKKLVRIAYVHAAGWQQAATLLKALQEQQDAQCNTVIIQGVLPQQQNVYAFTNGQLQFDRDVRLGGQTNNRYVVETENGFASDSTRFVLNE